MSFMDAPPRAELSLEEALAFFDGYDDPQAPQHAHTNSQSHAQQPPPSSLHMMNADVLMMMDDEPAAGPTSDDFAMGGGFLYGAAAAANDDFGLMLQPLQLDDVVVGLMAPAQNQTQATPMQALLAAPLTPNPSLGTTATRPQSRLSTRPQPSRTKTSAVGAAGTGTGTRPTGKAAKNVPATGSTTAALTTTATTSCSLTKQPSNSSSTKRVRRQKEELLYLRTKVVELEERLQQLRRVNGDTNSARGSPAPSSSDETVSASSPVQRPTAVSDAVDSSAWTSGVTARKKRRSEPCSSETDDDATPTTDALAAISPALLASVWENVAERQYKERLRAEQQNKKLKTMLESQIKLATSLEKILKRRPNMEVLHPDAATVATVTDGAAGATGTPLALAAQEPSPPPRTFMLRPIVAEETDAEVFQRQAQTIVDAYPRAAEVLAATGFFGADDSTHHDFRVKDFPDEDGVLMEFMATSTVPFDVEITGNALWRFLSDVSIKKHCYFEEVRDVRECLVSV